MRSPSGLSLVAAACVLSFLAALGGAWLALTLDEPDVVITERVIEVRPIQNTAEISPDDLEALRLIYVETTGIDATWTLGLVHEIAGSVCDEEQSADQLLASPLQADITMRPGDLESFVDEVRAVCP